MSTRGPKIAATPLERERAAEALAPAPESIWKGVSKRFRRHTLAKTGLVVILITSSIAVFAPVVAPYSPTSLNISLVTGGKPLPPNLQHPFGTDALGRYYLSRAFMEGASHLPWGSYLWVSL